jgi:hypothetical protein
MELGLICLYCLPGSESRCILCASRNGCWDTWNCLDLVEGKLSFSGCRKVGAPLFVSSTTYKWRLLGLLQIFFLLEHVGELHIINKRARRLKGQEPIRHTNLTDIKKWHLPFNVLVFAINIWRSVRNRMRQVLALTGTVKKGSPVCARSGEGSHYFGSLCMQPFSVFPQEPVSRTWTHDLMVTRQQHYCWPGLSLLWLDGTILQVTSARRHLFYQSNHKTQVIWKGRMSLICYSPTFPLLRASQGCWHCLLPLRRDRVCSPSWR